MPRILFKGRQVAQRATDAQEPSTSSSHSLPFALINMPAVTKLGESLTSALTSFSQPQQGVANGSLLDTLLSFGRPQQAPVSKAAVLRGALQAVEQNEWKKTILTAPGTLLELGGLVGATVLPLLSPQGPGGCDRTTCERCCNVLTSAPYAVAGVHCMRCRQTGAGKAWGAGLVAVSASSACFHGSYGRFRSFARKLDYWSIALASNLLTRAIYPQVPAWVTALGIAATPFKPFMVSSLNSAAVEYKFHQRAQKNPKVRRAQQLHSACLVAGMAAFWLEDVFPEAPLVHSTWHCLSTGAVASMNGLLRDVEENELGLKKL